MHKSIAQFKRLWSHIEGHRRKQLILLLVLMLLTSLAEMLSIGAIMPFLVVLTEPENVYDMLVMQPIFQILDIAEPNELLLPLTILFCIGAIVAGLMRISLLWLSARFSFALGTDISSKIYRHTLYQPYSVHCTRNSAEVIDSVAYKVNSVIYSFIMPTLMFASSSIILLAILTTLIFLQPAIVLVSFLGFGLIYALIIRLTRKKIIEDGECVARESTRAIRVLQEGLGGIRDVLIDGTQEIYCQVYRNADLLLRRAQESSLFIGSSPRYGVEALGLVFISILAYTLSGSKGMVVVLPALGVLALGAQRLLPALQQLYASWTQINSGQASLRNVLTLLDQPIPSYADEVNVKKIPFISAIVLKQVIFRYGEKLPIVLNGIGLTIPKGGIIGFIGSTGGGKSTLLDIIMGLLHPSGGTLEVDGRVINSSNCHAWRANIAHVPQSIYLTDGTIEENIAFGIPKHLINRGRVIEAAKKAQLLGDIESWPDQFQTQVGERGIRLSGGQRQRIGIARAFYKKASLIIFDEATSALDGETEARVMNAIEDLGDEITMLIVAHRLTTLKNCHQIIEINAGRIKRIGSFREIITQH